MRRARLRGAIWAAAACSCAAGCGSVPQAAEQTVETTDAACAEARTLTCTFFDGMTQTWSTAPPTAVSLEQACGAGGSHGEIDAFVDTRGQYWLDRLGFLATGSAVRGPSLGASDDAGGATYGCGRGGGKVLTQLFCGKDVGPGTLALRFTFAGRWADGTAWSKECNAEVAVGP
jgi:hypothetical protein